MISRRRNRKNWFIALGLFVAVFLFVFLVQKYKGASEVDAANLANFDPGYIISDYQMSNYNSMSEADIQRFLSSKNSCGNRDYSYYQRLSANTKYSWHFENGHFICLSEERFGNNDNEIGFQYGETAAHIIWQAAQDFRINPQVLIVLLQKETSLITDPIPNNGDYRKATGYGCPDTAACSSKYYGFKNQVRNAASLFRTVLNGGWTNYPLGSNYVKYNPNSDCGGSWVNIRSLATSALYRYTPYQPNASVLAAGYGTGDTCGAYGNRNFYLFFEDWFGGITSSEAASRGRTIEDGVYQFISVGDPNDVISTEGETYSGMTSGNTNISERNVNNLKGQTFEVKYDTRNGYYSIVDPITGLALDVEAASLNNNAQILLWQQHDGCNQDWVIAQNGNEEYTIISRCSSRVLDATSANDLVTYENHGGSNQRWLLGKIAESRGKTIEDGVYQFISLSDSVEAIDIVGGVKNGMKSGDTNISSRKIDNMDSQLFDVKYNSNSGYYNITNPKTGLSLDLAGAEVRNGASVVMWQKNGGCNQDWVIVPNSDESYTVISRCSSKVFDATWLNDLITYGSHGGSNQKWYFGKIAKSKGRTVDDGVYRFVSKANPNKVIDIALGVYPGMTSGNTILYERKSMQIDNQVFEAKYDEGTGYYEIINPTSGIVLDVSAGGVTDLTPVLAWKQHGGCNQDWVLEPDGDGYYVISSRCSSKVLDATSMDKLILYRYHEGDNQKWSLIRENL